jgi:hypothetical protein
VGVPVTVSDEYHRLVWGRIRAAGPLDCNQGYVYGIIHIARVYVLSESCSRVHYSPAMAELLNAVGTLYYKRAYSHVFGMVVELLHCHCALGAVLSKPVMIMQSSVGVQSTVSTGQHLLLVVAGCHCVYVFASAGFVCGLIGGPGTSLFVSASCSCIRVL